jgi:SAM-dependent methyltransferase
MTPVSELHASAARARASLLREAVRPVALRAALARVPPGERDAWVDLVLGIDDVPADGPELPRGGVPYMPCAVDALLCAIDGAELCARDVFVDIGSGLGRAATLAHLLTGARAIGVEIQPHLVQAARQVAARANAAGVSFVEGDAAELAGAVADGTVFFLYCPFGGERLTKLFGELERAARRRAIRVCSVDLPLPPAPWLALARPAAGGVTVHRSGPT